MLIETWEKLRGYDKWIETKATVTSSNIETRVVSGRYGPETISEAGDVITWTDQRGEQQYADFNVPPSSPLYQLISGESVSIRYNPAKPEEFYYRDLLRTRIKTVCGQILGLVAVISFLALRIWARIMARSHR